MITIEEITTKTYYNLIKKYPDVKEDLLDLRRVKNQLFIISSLCIVSLGFIFGFIIGRIF